MVQHEIGIIVAVAALITALVAFASIHYLKKQLVISEEASNDSRKAYEDTRKSFEDSRKAYEDTRKSYGVDTLFRIKDKFLEEDVLELIQWTAHNRNKPLFKKYGGPYEEKIILKTVNMINEIGMFIEMGIVSEDLITRSVGAFTNDFYGHKDVQDYIKDAQKRTGSNLAWGNVKVISDKYDVYVKNSQNK